MHTILNPNGKYLSVCFNENDPLFKGSGKYVKTRIDTVLYLSSKNELRNLFDPCFYIRELKVIELSGKSVTHIMNYAFMEKR